MKIKKYSNKTITGYVASILTEFMYNDPTVLSRFASWAKNPYSVFEVFNESSCIFFRRANSPRFDNKLVISSFYQTSGITEHNKTIEFDWPKDVQAFIGRVCSQVQNFM